MGLEIFHSSSCLTQHVDPLNTAGGLLWHIARYEQDNFRAKWIHIIVQSCRVQYGTSSHNAALVDKENLEWLRCKRFMCDTQA